MRTPRRRRPGLLSEVSSPGELHPEALSERCVNLSIHTAPIIQPFTALLMPSHSSLQRKLVRFRQRDSAAPSLPSHYKSFHATTGSSAPYFGIGILPHGVCHLSFPFSSEARFSRSIPKPVLSSCRLYPDCRRVRKQVSPRLVPEHPVDSGFDSTL